MQVSILSWFSGLNRLPAQLCSLCTILLFPYQSYTRECKAHVGQHSSYHSSSNHAPGTAEVGWGGVVSVPSCRTHTQPPTLGSPVTGPQAERVATLTSWNVKVGDAIEASVRVVMFGVCLGYIVQRCPMLSPSCSATNTARYCLNGDV